MTCEIVRAGGSIIFLHGSGERSLFTCAGTVKPMKHKPTD